MTIVPKEKWMHLIGGLSLAVAACLLGLACLLAPAPAPSWAQSQLAPSTGFEAPLASSVDWKSAVLVTVHLRSFRFDSSHLPLRRNVVYRLRLVNPSGDTHDFTAPEFFRAITLREPDALAPYGDRVTVQPHDHKELDFVASTAGTFRLICEDHNWHGMEGQIVIE